MTSIGGYFELELKDVEHFPHSHCNMLNSGRHALEFILKSIAKPVTKIWIPKYTCKVILEPINRLGIPFEFYSINENFEIKDEPDVKENEFIIANNYFGIKDQYINQLATKYGNKLIIDNAQAWYAPELLGIKAFYSPRKFFGIPDGGVAWTPISKEIVLEQGYSFERCSHLLKRHDLGAKGGYSDFNTNSESLRNEPMRKMSKLTYRLLSSIDYEDAKIRRRNNYQTLANALDSSNLLKLPDRNSFACPMVYPYMTENVLLRKHLIKNDIFVAQYWYNYEGWYKENSIEKHLMEYLIPLPCDQRYGNNEMERIITKITSEIQ